MEIELHTAVLPIAQSKYGFTASVRFQPCTKFSFSFIEFSQINVETIKFVQQKFCSWQNKTLDMEHIVAVKAFVNLWSSAS